MLPTLNGKSFLHCTEEDLQALIDNPDYRENEYIDYKANFAFLGMDKKNPERQLKIVEFRNDVCAFANAGGGYLIYGITDEKGMAKEIVGIEIPNNNTDKFELERKNNLDSIMPKVPALQFGYIPLENGNFVVIIQIRKDGFVPYVHLENEMNYKVYKRVGNGKSPIGYVELKNMFNQSLSIESEVQAFRQKRIDFYRSQEDTPDNRYSKFVLFHIIPDTFTDPYTHKNMFLLHKKQPSLKLSSIFYGIRCSYLPCPNVDGMRFAGDGRDNDGIVYNNGSIECFFPAHNYLFTNRYEKLSFEFRDLWKDITPVIRQYISVMKSVLETKRLFLCLTVVGCKNAITNHNVNREYIGSIDRDIILCNPITIEDISDDDIIENAIKWLHIEYFLSLGIRENDDLDRLIAEVNGNDNH